MKDRYHLRDKHGTKIIADVMEDNTIKATIHLKVSEDKDVREVFKEAEWSIEYKEALKHGRLFAIK